MDIIFQYSAYIIKNDKNPIKIFYSNYKFYHIKSEIDYVLGVNITENNVEMFKYSISDSLIVKFIESRYDNILVRKWGSNDMYIENKVVTKICKASVFNPAFKLPTGD